MASEGFATDGASKAPLACLPKFSSGTMPAQTVATKKCQESLHRPATAPAPVTPVLHELTCFNATSQ